jgi:DNA primase
MISKIPKKKLKGGPSVIKKAITLILNYPSIANDITHEQIGANKKPGVEILKKLLTTIQEKPQITTAGLIELWRDDPEGKFLGQLAITELPENEDFNAKNELQDCLHQITKENHKARITHLIDKQSNNELTPDEKKEFKNLISKNISN